MEKKYEELIISLIQDHRKYSGLESILDDIVNDVYKHAEVVINNVTDESVLAAYLAKIVNNSIITVPKSLNIGTKRISKQIDISSIINNKENKDRLFYRC